MIALGLLLALAASPGPEAFTDADLARFCPAVPGMVAVYRYTDARGQLLRTSTQVTQRVDRPDDAITQLLVRQRDVAPNGYSRSQLAQGTIHRDRLEVEDLEAGREPTVELRTPLVAGASWAYQLSDGEGRRTILGVEPVSVAAGAFPRALHVLVRSRCGNAYLEAEEWFVPDVGLVKVVTPAMTGELVSLKRDPTPTRRP
jgi:hypothetical protein